MSFFQSYIGQYWFQMQWNCQDTSGLHALAWGLNLHLAHWSVMYMSLMCRFFLKLINLFLLCACRRSMAVLPTFPAVTLAARTLCIDEGHNRLLNDLSAVWENSKRNAWFNFGHSLARRFVSTANSARWWVIWLPYSSQDTSRLYITSRVFIQSN